MAIIKYGNDYVVKQYGSGRTNSGPSGRRKTRAFRVYRKAVAEASAKYGIVLWCCDQHGGHGTQHRGKFDSNNNDLRRQGLPPLAIKTVDLSTCKFDGSSLR